MNLARLRWIVLALLSLSTVINYVDRQALAVLLPSFRSDLHITSAQYGAITTWFLIAYMVGQVVGGVVIDRLGTRRGFIAAISAWSIAALAHAFAVGPWSLSACRALLGLGEAANWPAGGKAVSEWFPRSRGAFAMGVFDGGSAVGAIIAPPLIAALALWFGWRSAFIVIGSLGFVWLGAWMWAYRKPCEHPWLEARERAIAAAEVGVPLTTGAGSFCSLRTIAGVRQLWGLTLTRMMASPVWWFYVFWLPDYLAKDRGFTLREIGLFGWIPFLAVDFGKLFGGALSDQMLARGLSHGLARKGVMAAASLAMLGGVRVAQSGSAMAAIAWVSLATFGFGMWSANILALHADLFPSHVMGTAVGVTGAGASLGAVFFTYATGLLVDTHGYAPAFWVAGTAPLVASLSLIFVMGRVETVNVSEAVYEKVR